MRGRDRGASRLCTGHRARRPKIEVNCPGCNVTIDTEAAMWITCPNPKCAVTFNRHTGEILGQGPERKNDEAT
jgi:hypothetical protein